MFGFIRDLFRRESAAPPNVLTPKILALKIEQMMARVETPIANTPIPPLPNTVHRPPRSGADIDVRGEAKRKPRRKPVRKAKPRKKRQ